MDNKKDKQKYRIATHGGTFHADDVFAVAAMLLYLEDAEVEIVRTREREVYEGCDFVIDVGDVYDPKKWRFDHHQPGGAGVRENGIPYAAFGLIWKTYGEHITGSLEVAREIDEHMIQTIDGLDNGVDVFEEYDDIDVYLINDLISASRPTWKEEERTNDDGFFEVLPMAKFVLERVIRHKQDVLEGQKYVREAYEQSTDKRLIVLERNYPWGEVIARHSEPLYIVLPHDEDNGNWKVRAVPTFDATFENRKDLPEEWAGKRNEELAETTGVPDAVFCHNKRFIAVAGSKEGALALAHRALTT